ncbi:MAG: sulfotransferase [Rhizobiaceae bacterium]|nr:sulfotransferase [Rhizobiaceae bacterium]
MSKQIKHQWSLGHNYLTGITFGKWLRLLAENNMAISPTYFHRAAFITCASLVNSGFAAIEKLRFERKIQKVNISDPPLFILGHWRSGTTLLHDLLAQDVEQFQFPNTYQVVNPLTFLTTENLMTRLFPGLVPPRRPMDNMALSFQSPQEDEFAPLLMTLKSLYLGTSFPKRTAEYEKYLTFHYAEAREVDEWCDAFVYFCKKLSLQSDRSLLIKSPPHTARVRWLLRMFPDAKFIHIHRDPYRVFQSQRHFFDTAGWYTYLQRPNLETLDDEILQRYVTMYDAYFEDRKLIPDDRFHEIRFDDLEADTVQEIEKTYAALSLDGFPEFKPSLERYVSSLKNYKKNTFHSLDEESRLRVSECWSRSFERWGYDI